MNHGLLVGMTPEKWSDYYRHWRENNHMSKAEWDKMFLPMADSTGASPRVETTALRFARLVLREVLAGRDTNSQDLAHALRLCDAALKENPCV